MARSQGPRQFKLKVDADGNRTYTVPYLVIVDPDTEGIVDAYNAIGLPAYGDNLPQIPGSDLSDDWATCLPDTEVSALDTDKERGPRYLVIKTFSTKPSKRCMDIPIEDPLLEPPRVSGSTSKYQEEAALDRFGLPIRNSAFEQYKGKQIEFDANRTSLKITYNVATFEEVVVAQQMENTVNGYELWGYAPRCIKLSSVHFERKYKGTCQVHFTLDLEFDFNLKTFDRDLVDQGTKALNGQPDANHNWVLKDIGGQPPNPLNPLHFVKYLDAQGHPTNVVLNGHGVPAISIQGATLYSVATATLVGAGTGYAPNDVLTAVGGVFSKPAQVTVTSSTVGVITGIALTDPGSYSVEPPNTVSTRDQAGGGGSGCTVNFTWSTTPSTISSAKPANFGSGYTVGDTLQVQGGTPTGLPPPPAIPPANFINPPIQNAVLTVTKVGIGGAVTGVSVANGGSYDVQPGAPANVLGGTGVGATFIFSLAATTDTVTSAAPDVTGFNYSPGDILTVVGGAGTPAQILVLTTLGTRVDNVTLYSGGTYTVDPPVASVPTTSTGPGMNATFNLNLGPSFNAAVAINPNAPGNVFVSVYDESDFLLLGIPLTFDD